MARGPHPMTYAVRAHLGLDRSATRRIVNSLADVAKQYGTDVKTLMAEVIRAENSSAAGNHVSP